MAPLRNKARRDMVVGTEPWLEQYAHARDLLPGAQLPWLARLRDAGRDRFAVLGLPTNRNEAWKYTSLRPLSRMSFANALPSPAEVAPPALLTDSHRLVFVDGRLSVALSTPGELPGRVTLGSLADAITATPELVEQHLGRIGGIASHPMLALNTALMADGLFLHVRTKVEVERPIEIVHVATAREGAPAVHPRHLVLVEAGASITLVEHYVGGDRTYMLNGAAEIRLAEGATLRHYKLQEEGPEAYHLFLNQVHIGADAEYDSFVLSLGARLARNQIEAVIDGAGARCILNGAYLGSARQHLDHTSVIDHTAPNARSRQVYHGVLDGQSRGVFQGQIVVRQAAQKTDGYQINRALLLSDGAEIDSKPGLEIYADDVKCSHGATVGELDSDALFYLRARGIPEPAARRLLVEAFLADAVRGGAGRGHPRAAAGPRRRAGWQEPCAMTIQTPAGRANFDPTRIRRRLPDPAGRRSTASR